MMTYKEFNKNVMKDIYDSMSEEFSALIEILFDAVKRGRDHVIYDYKLTEIELDVFQVIADNSGFRYTISKPEPENITVIVYFDPDLSVIDEFMAGNTCDREV